MGPTDAGRAWTVADLSMELAAPAVVVARAGLGTLNHTALTLEALAQRGIKALLVIGAWPAEPDLVHRTNIVDLPGELAGAVPAGAGRLAQPIFRASAPSWLSPTLHGRFDPAEFRGWVTTA
jgi:dethiobiotin synthetase